MPKREYLTVIVVGSTDRKSRTFHLPRLVLGVATGVAALIVVAFCASGWLYLTTARSMEEIEALHAQRERQSRAIEQVMGQLAQVQSDVDALAAQRRKLANMLLLGLSGSEGRSKVLGGVGGLATPARGADPVVLFRGNDADLLASLDGELGLLRRDLEGERRGQAGLEQVLRGRLALLDAMPSIRPVEGGWISSGFARRRDPWTGALRMHKGLDIAHSESVPVHATGQGKVVFAGREGGYGKLVEIDHGFGLRTRYAHLARIAVKVGDEVQRGTTVGRLGNTGRSTGPHLHYEVLVHGVQVDPAPFLLDGEDGATG